MKKSYLSICLLIVLGLSISVHGQDSQYWSQQFGTRSALMSGAVVAGTEDNSMIYYNPGSLGFITESNISVNANLYQLSNIKVRDALGNQQDFVSSQLGQVPLLISGMLSNESRKWQIGYALLSPVYFTFKGSVRSDGFIDIIDNDESPGEEETIIDLSRDMKVSEILGGVGFGKKLSDNLAIGFTHFFDLRSESFNNNFLTYVFLNDDENTLVNLTDIENVSYYNVRYFLKAGISWIASERLKIGLTLTSPSINLFGNGTVAANISADNIMIGDNRTNIVGSDRQDKLKSKYHSPFSASVGLTYSAGKNIIGFTAAYFTGINPYTILNAEPASFIRPSDVFGDFTSDEFLIVRTAAKPVFNVALGYEYLVSESLSLIFSARNDMTYYEELDESGIQLEFSNWDIIHLVAGANIIKDRSTLTFGFLPSFGNNKRFNQEGGIDDEDDFLGGDKIQTQANYLSLGILLGFTYNFKKF